MGTGTLLGKAARAGPSAELMFVWDLGGNLGADLGHHLRLWHAPYSPARDVKIKQMKLKKVWPLLTAASESHWEIWGLNLSLTLLLNLFVSSVNWGQKHPYCSCCPPSPGRHYLWFFTWALCVSRLDWEQSGWAPRSRVLL